MSLAPNQWRKVIRDILGNKQAAKATSARDWVMEQVTQPLVRDDAHRAAILLQAAAPVFRPTKDAGSALFDVAQAAEGHAEPLQFGAAHLWGRSQAFKASTAVEAAEAAPALTAKRGWAVTLTGCERGSRARFVAGVREAMSTWRPLRSGCSPHDGQGRRRRDTDAVTQAFLRRVKPRSLSIGNRPGSGVALRPFDFSASPESGDVKVYPAAMASYGRVVGGDHLNATINPNVKGELALTGRPFKRTSNLVPDAVESWEEIFPEGRGGGGAIGKVGQAVARSALPGFAGKAASAAVESAMESARRPPHTVRVDWVGGGQSLIELPDKLFQHFAVVLLDCQIPSTPPPEPLASAAPSASSGVLGRVARLVGDGASAQRSDEAPVSQPDITEQISKLAALRDQGVLTDEEFTAKKTELLGRL